MRALTYVEPGVLRWQETPDPPLLSHGALVRPLAVARCDLDAPMAAFGIFPGPFAVGHEIAAEVVEAGPETSLRTGDRVAVTFQVSCGTCPRCTSGRTASCSTYRSPAGAAFGFGPRGGGHGGGVADLLSVPHADHLLVPAPAGLSDVALATLPDGAVDAWRTVGPHLAARPGAEVLVLGGSAPSIALYAVALAQALGASHTRYVDVDPERCRVAAALGAHAELRAGPWPRRYDRAEVVVDASGDEDGMRCAIRSTDDQGVLTLVGILFGDASLPVLEMYSRGIMVVLSRPDSRQHLPEVLRLAATGAFDPLGVPTTTVPIEDAADAWLAPAMKLVVVR